MCYAIIKKKNKGGGGEGGVKLKIQKLL